MAIRSLTDSRTQGPLKNTADNFWQKSTNEFVHLVVQVLRHVKHDNLSGWYRRTSGVPRFTGKLSGSCRPLCKQQTIRKNNLPCLEYKVTRLIGVKGSKEIEFNLERN